jgi:hypothetical protein
MEVSICKFLHLCTTNLTYLEYIHDPPCTSDIVFHIIAIKEYWMGINGTLFIDTPTCLDIWTSIKQKITCILVKTVKPHSICCMYQTCHVLKYNKVILMYLNRLYAFSLQKMLLRMCCGGVSVNILCVKWDCFG